MHLYYPNTLRQINPLYAHIYCLHRAWRSARCLKTKRPNFYSKIVQWYLGEVDSLRSSLLLNQVWKIPNPSEAKLGSISTCVLWNETEKPATKLLLFLTWIVEMSLRLKSSSSKRTKKMSRNNKSVGCHSCSYLCLLTSSADYPGNIMVTHFTVPAPNSVLLQVSKSSPSRDSQTSGRKTRLPKSPFKIRPVFRPTCWNVS